MSSFTGPCGSVVEGGYSCGTCACSLRFAFSGGHADAEVLYNLTRGKLIDGRALSLDLALFASCATLKPLGPLTGRDSKSDTCTVTQANTHLIIATAVACRYDPMAAGTIRAVRDCACEMLSECDDASMTVSA